MYSKRSAKIFTDVAGPHRRGVFCRGSNRASRSKQCSAMRPKASRMHDTNSVPQEAALEHYITVRVPSQLTLPLEVPMVLDADLPSLVHRSVYVQTSPPALILLVGWRSQ
eukprot:6489602-Amphidinium_carterae.1